MRNRFAVVVAATLLCIPAIARTAQDDASPRPSPNDPCLRHRACRHHVERGALQAVAGRLAESLAEYQAAYAIRRAPWLLYNIARLLHRLERSAAAISYYQLYLEASDSKNPEQARSARSYMAQARLDAAAAEQLASNAEALVPQVKPLIQPSTRLQEQSVSKPWWLFSVLGVIVAVGVADGVVAATHQAPSAYYPIPPGWPSFRPFK